MIGVTVTPDQVVIARVAEAFDAGGNLVWASDVEALNNWAGELICIAGTRGQVAA